MIYIVCFVCGIFAGFCIVLYSIQGGKARWYLRVRRDKDIVHTCRDSKGVKHHAERR